MAISPKTATDRGGKTLFDHTIVTVERAASELRRGRPVLAWDQQRAVVVQSAELLQEDWIDGLRSLADGEPVVGLTYNRANILHVLPRSGDVALVLLPEIMAGDSQARVIQSMADPDDDLMRPLLGPFHVAPTGAEPMHEAGLKLCKLARLLPAALFSASFDVPDAPGWAAARGLLSVAAKDIMSYDQSDAAALRQITAAKVPLAGAEQTTMVAFRPDDGGTEHFALLIGDPNRHDPVLTRIHSECFTGDLLGSLKCDCGEQLNGAIRHMQNQGGGVLLYLAQEGRGIGLINKLRAYQLQDQGFDTVDANERLGFQSDERIFGPAAQMLKIMGFDKVRLLTNNPLKVEGLEACGVTVTERVKHAFPSNAHNDHYLKTKKKRSGHLLP
ncbi:GTP cyclohydrolase II [Paremcibacter congregatus]|uniref:GTP cyclohydrolase II n=1 Tax=Paremcibacter congregatus TaxID=2043170 RepID=UPI003A935C7B